MKDKLKKLDIPPPSDDLEDRILAGATPNQKWLPKLAVMAACFVIVIAVWNNQPIEDGQTNNIDVLADIEFFDEEGFIEDLS